VRNFPWAHSDINAVDAKTRTNGAMAAVFSVQNSVGTAVIFQGIAF